MGKAKKKEFEDYDLDFLDEPMTREEAKLERRRIRDRTNAAAEALQFKMTGSDDPKYFQSEPEEVKIGPQPGPQTAFLTTEADIAIYGGAAGGGKTFALLLEPLRHIENPLFGGVVFRRNSVQVRNEGGLWDESQRLYPLLNGYPREAFLEWSFPEGPTIKFAHLEYDKSVLDWQGSQIAYIAFDELTHFTEKQFFYMLSRNRSMSGVPGYVRATCNPDADSWVRNFIDWWIGKDGYPIPERSGKLRWFIKKDDSIHWANTREELLERFGKDELPKSVTFIAANVHDNQILLKKDPSYLANLKALSRVDRLRLEGGNWNVRATAGMFFRREWMPIVDALPAGAVRCVRFWDRASTPPNGENKDPDWTRGVKLYQYADGSFVLADIRSIRDTPGKVRNFIKAVASHDGPKVSIRAQRDPGSAGVEEAEHFVTMLQGYDVGTAPFSKDKVTRAKAVSAQCEVGNVKVLRGDWNEEFFRESENFPDGAHDDQVDGFSGAFNDLVINSGSILNVL